MEISQPRAPEIPPRPNVPSLVSPPVPTRWDLCLQHTGNKYTAICVTCTKFLCQKCLMSEIYFHQQCYVAYLSDDIVPACRKLNDTVTAKLESINRSMTDFHNALTKKRKRMLKKRDQTVGEIERYFTRLKDKFISKLRKDEAALLDVMKLKVNEQDEMIRQKIEQCNATLNSMSEKRAMLQSVERLCSSRRGGNSVSFLKNLIKTSEELNKYGQTEKDIASTRDAFLVIRFFVNTETEQLLLNNHIACLEVLSSRSDGRNIESLESESINESTHTQPVGFVEMATTEAQTDASSDQFVVSIPEKEKLPLTDITSRELRVVLPQIASDTPSRLVRSQNEVMFNPTEPSENPTLAETPSLNQEESTFLKTQENGCELEPVNMPSTIPNTRFVAFGHVDDAPNTDESTTDLQSDVNEDADSASQAEDGDATISNSMEKTSECMILTEEERNDATIIERVGTRVEGAEASSGVNNRHNHDSNSNLDVRRRMDRCRSVDDTLISRHRNVDERNREAGNIHDDDLPPPYPGLPSSPIPPGPDELPPPYSTGPPPPYSRGLLPQHISANRPRDEDESGSDRGFLGMTRPASDTDLQSRMTEIAAPTQTQTPRLSRPKLENMFSVNEANDRRVSGVFSLTTILGNNLLIVDRWNKKLKYFSSSGISFGGLIFREEPWDITEIAHDFVAVTVPKLNTLYKVKVSDDAVVTTGTVSTQRSYACIAFSVNKGVFVCGQVPQFGEPLIDVIGINGGAVIQTFRSSPNNPLLSFSYPRYVQVDEEGTAMVCDWNLKCLIVFQLDGTVLGRYRGTVEFPLNEPTGMTYNPAKKEIYVIDQKHNSTLGAIHIVTLNCRCKEIIRWDNEFRVARAIASFGNGYILGNKSGVMSVFSTRGRRRDV